MMLRGAWKQKYAHQCYNLPLSSFDWTVGSKEEVSAEDVSYLSASFMSAAILDVTRSSKYTNKTAGIRPCTICVRPVFMIDELQITMPFLVLSGGQTGCFSRFIDDGEWLHTLTEKAAISKTSRNSFSSLCTIFPDECQYSRLVSPSCRQIGQYEQQLYARYFELSEAAAEEKIEGVMREMRARALRGVEPESGENSWLARQNKRVTGSRSRAKGVQLGRAATLAEVKEVFAVQQETCCVTGQPIYLGKGGLESGMCAAMVLVGRSRTFQLMGCWIARGQGSCPRAAYKEFFEYWGVEGHQYMRFLTVGPEGEVVDELERRVMSILGVDEEGNPVGESILEASVVDNAKPVGGAGVGRTNPSETGSSVGDVSEADRGEQRTRAPDMLVSDLNEAETANEEIREPDAENSVGEAGTGFAEPGKVGSIASEGSTAFAEMDKLVGGPSTLVAETVVAGSHVGRPTDEVAERRVLADGAVSEQEALARESSEASSRRAQPEPEPDPEPESESLSPRLPLVGVHHSWAAVRGPLMEKPMKRGDEKYRRAGLSLLRPSPALADFDDSSFKNTYKAPVLVERDNLALEWTGTGNGAFAQ